MIRFILTREFAFSIFIVVFVWISTPTVLKTLHHSGFFVALALVVALVPALFTMSLIWIPREDRGQQIRLSVLAWLGWSGFAVATGVFATQSVSGGHHGQFFPAFKSTAISIATTFSICWIIRLIVNLFKGWVNVLERVFS